MSLFNEAVSAKSFLWCLSTTGKPVHNRFDQCIGASFINSFFPTKIIFSPIFNVAMHSNKPLIITKSQKKSNGSTIKFLLKILNVSIYHWLVPIHRMFNSQLNLKSAQADFKLSPRISLSRLHMQKTEKDFWEFLKWPFDYFWKY